MNPGNISNDKTEAIERLHSGNHDLPVCFRIKGIFMPERKEILYGLKEIAP